MAINSSQGTPPAPNTSQKVMTGARALIYVNNQLAGVYESCSYTISFGTEPIHILGLYNTAEIAITSYEAVTLNCSGFRVVNNGPHVLPAVPKLQDLLALEGTTISVVDRQTGLNILTAIGCVVTGHSGGYNARATSRITVNYTGLVLSDESGDQNDPGAASLP